MLELKETLGIMLIKSKTKQKLTLVEISYFLPKFTVSEQS